MLQTSETLPTQTTTDATYYKQQNRKKPYLPYLANPSFLILVISWVNCQGNVSLGLVINAAQLLITSGIMGI